MLWTIGGWVVAKAASAACSLPGMGGRAGDWLGRALRRALPWRLAGSAGRWVASGAGSRLELSWALCAAGMLLGAHRQISLGQAGAAAAWVAAGASAPILANLSNRSARVAVARGRMWLGLISSSELCLSLGSTPAGPGAWGRPSALGPLEPRASIEARRMGRHPGFAEMARRLCAPRAAPGEAEPAAALRARCRLRAMMLACAGSEPAARWLWRRRKSRLSMARWARFLGEGAPDRGELWEMSAAIMSICSLAKPIGGPAVHFDASEATESSLPMLWATAPEPRDWLCGGDFAVGVRREAMRAATGMGEARWGWAAEGDDGSAFKRKTALSLGTAVAAWSKLIARAPALLEAESLDHELPPGSRGACRRRGL